MNARVSADNSLSIVEEGDFMLINFKQQQYIKFKQLANRVQADPQTYLNFDSIADVYAADWLKELPPMSKWYVSGLDDGEGQFLLCIEFAGEQIIFETYEDSLF